MAPRNVKIASVTEKAAVLSWEPYRALNEMEKSLVML